MDIDRSSKNKTKHEREVKMEKFTPLFIQTQLFNPALKTVPFWSYSMFVFCTIIIVVQIE